MYRRALGKKAIGTGLGLLFVAALLMACAPPEAETALAMAEVDPGSIVVDGSQEGYPAEPVLDDGTAEVYLAHDGEDFFFFARAQSEGWISVGFNEQGRGMDGANMIMGNLENGAEVRNDLGEGHGHAEVDAPGIEEHYIETTADEVIMEVRYPLAFPDNGFALAGLEPGGEYSILVAYHETSTDPGTKHSQRATTDFLVE